MTCKSFVRAAALSALLLSSPFAHAANKYFSDAGGPLTWDNSQTNWGTVSGGPYTNATWATWDAAIFEGTGGVVYVNGPYANTVTFNVDGYALTNSTINFGNPGGYNFTAAANCTGSIYSTVNQVYGTGIAKTGAGTIALFGAGNVGNNIQAYQGVLQIGGGSLSLAGDFYVGRNSFGTTDTSLGTFLMSGGTLTVGGGNFILGQTINGSTKVAQFTQTGGAATYTGGWLAAGNGGGVSQFDFSGGAFTSTTAGLSLGVRGHSTLNVAGNAFVSVPNITMGHSVSASTVNKVSLNGGTLKAQYVSKAGGSTATFVFNGGTLLAAANQGSFMTGLSTGLVQSGGAIIDTTNFNVTIAQALLAGASDGGLTKWGSGNLTLTGANTYTGATCVASGTLQLGAGSNSGSLGGGPVIVSNGCLFLMYRNDAPTLASPVSGSGNWIVQGTATLNQSDYVITGNNSGFTGTLTVTNGARFQAGAVNRVGAGSSIYVVNGGQIYATAVGVYTQALYISGLGFPEGAGNLGALRIENGTWSGPITLLGDSRIDAYSASGSISNIIAGTYRLDLGSVAGNLYVNGAITGSGSIYKFGGNSVFLGGNDNGFTGIFTNSTSNVMFTGPNAGSSNAAWFISSGTFNNAQAGTVTTHLGSLAGTGGSIGNNTAGSAWTLIVGELNTSTIFSGSLLDTVGGGGTMSFVKAGTGTLTLNGAGTYTGTTAINSGSLIVNGSIGSGAVTLAAGATLGGSGAVRGAVNSSGLLAPGFAGTGVLTVSNDVTQSSGGAMLFKIGGSTPGSGHDQLKATGTVTVDGALTVTNINGYLPNGSSFTIVSAGNILGNFASSNLPALTPGFDWQIQYTTTSVVLSAVATSAANALVWAPTLSADWDLASSNWYNASLVSTGLFAHGDDTLFDDSGAYSNSVNLSVALAPKSVTVNSASNYTFSGPGYLSGGMGLTKDGSGTLVVTTTNNVYGGGTTISNGTLQLGAGGACGTLGSGPVANGGTLAFNNSDNGTFNLPVGGTGRVVKAGTGDVNMTAANTYAGGSTVSAGRFRISASNALPAGSTVIVQSGGELFVPAAGTYTNDLLLAGDGGNSAFDTQPRGALRIENATIAPAATVTLTADASIGTYSGAGGTVNAPVGESGGSRALTINKSATATPSTVTLGGANTYSGPTTIGAGTLSIASAGTLTAGIYLAPITNNGTLAWNSSADQELGGVINGTGALTKNGGGTMTLSASNTYAGATTVGAGTLLLTTGGVISNASAINVQGTAGATLTINGGAVWDALNSGNAIYAGATAGNTGTVNLVSGSVVLSGASATTTLGDSGTGIWNQNGGSAVIAGAVWLANNGSGVGLFSISNGTASIGSLQLGVRNAATLAISGPSASVMINNGMSMGYYNVGNSYSTVNMSDGTLVISNGLTMGQSSGGSSSSTWNQTGGTATVASGGFTIGNWGGGSQQMTVSGGSFNFTAASTYFAIRGNASYPTMLTVSNTGLVNLYGLILGHTGGNATGTRTINLDGGTLQLGAAGVTYNAGVFTVNLNGGTLKAASSFSWVATTNVSLRVLDSGVFIDTVSNTVTINQPLVAGGTGVGGLTKQGAGTLVLTAANTHGGTTRVTNGTLLVNGSLSTGTVVTVASAGTLGGTGLVCGAVTVDGTLAPGANGVGTLAVSNAVTFNAASTLSVELGGTNVTQYDVLDMSMCTLDATIDGGTLKVRLVNGYFPQAGDSFTVIKAFNIAPYPSVFPSTDLPDLSASNLAWTVTNTGSELIIGVISTGGPVLSGYDAYSNQFALAGGPAGDANGDGWQNLAAYALGFDPTGAAHAGLSGGIVSGKLSLTFDVLDSRSDITYWAETSDTLMTNDAGWTWIWTNKPIQTLAGPDAVVLGTSGETNTVRVSDPAAGTNRFLRLRITRP